MTATTEPGAPAGWAPPEPTPSALARLRERRPWAPPAAVGALVGAAVAYTAWQDPTKGGLFPRCPLYELTGLDCPGCGGTRAVHAFAHGDIATAFDRNAVLAVVLPALAVLWAVWMVHAVRGTLARRRQTPPPAWPGWLRPRLPQWGWLGIIVFLVAFGVLRNVSAVPVLDFLGSEV